MGILGTQAARLRKRFWSSPQMLADELYSMFTADVPVVIDSPLQIQNPTNAPAIQITQSEEAAPGMPAISITNPPGGGGFTAAPVAVVPSGPVGPRTTTPPSGTTTTPSTGSNIVSRTSRFQTTERHDFKGTITGGSGRSYTIALEDNLREPQPPGTEYTINAAATVTATVRDAADDAQWDAGTFVQVVTRTRRVQVDRRTAFDSAGNVISVYDTRTVLGSETWEFQLPVWL